MTPPRFNGLTPRRISHAEWHARDEAKTLHDLHLRAIEHVARYRAEPTRARFATATLAITDYTSQATTQGLSLLAALEGTS